MGSTPPPKFPGSTPPPGGAVHGKSLACVIQEIDKGWEGVVGSTEIDQLLKCYDYIHESIKLFSTLLVSHSVTEVLKSLAYLKLFAE